MTGPREAEPGEQPPGRRSEAGRRREAGREAEGEDGPAARSWRFGEMPGSMGMAIVVIAALLGAIASLATKREPGTVLGGSIVAGTLVAGFAVRRRSVYLLIPVPVLSYLVFALAEGLLYNRSTPSASGLTVSAAQWVANGFPTMIAATVVAVVITAGRWLWGRRARAAAAGSGPRPQGGPGGRRRPEAGETTRRTQEPRAHREARPEPEARPRPRRGRDPEWPDAQWDRSDSDDWRVSAHRREFGSRDAGDSRDWGDRRGQGYGRERDGRQQPGWDRQVPPGPPSFGSSRDSTR